MDPVPYLRNWLDIIREFGGEMKETYGVPVEEIQEGIKNGVRKINIDTDIRLAMSGAVRRHLAKNKSEFDPRKFSRMQLPPPRISARLVLKHSAALDKLARSSRSC